MSRASFQPDRFTDGAAFAALKDEVRVLKEWMRKRRDVSLAELIDVDLENATSGSVLTRGAGAKWRAGTASAFNPVSVLIGDASGGTAAGNGSNVVVPFTDLSSSTYGTPDIVATTPSGSWTIPAGIYIVSAQVRWSTLGGVREVRLAGSAFPSFVPVELQVAAAAAEETVLTISSGAFHAAVSGDIRVIARQTSGGAGTVYGEGLTIVRIAPYVYTP